MGKFLTLEGVPQLQATLARVARETRTAADAAVDSALGAVLKDAQAGAPVDTRELRDSIKRTDDEVRATAPHSGYVEHGTVKAPAQPFMAPAAEGARVRFPVKAGALIRAALGSIRP